MEPVDGAAEEDDFDGKAENGGGRLSLWELVWSLAGSV